MKILAAEFVKSCATSDQFPADRLPEVACIGRSNVGKSSLINAWLNRRDLAKVSGTPGKTRLLNFFRIVTADPVIGTFYIVDLPGYGFAKVAKSVRVQWGPMIERYLTRRPELRGGLLLIDSRRIQSQDVWTYAWLRALGLRVVVVATKVDKLNQGERRQNLDAIRQTLQLPETVPLLPYSAIKREGIDELRRVIRDLLLSK